MTPTLPAELQGFIQDKINAGTFSSEEEVIRAAVSLMKANDTEYARQLEWLRDAIDIGWEQAKAGQLLTMEEVRADLEEHKKQWRARHSANA